jgi:hypothetical protein
MPFDVIKTYMQTHGAEAAAAGARGQLAAFWATGALLPLILHAFSATPFCACSIKDGLRQACWMQRGHAQELGAAVLLLVFLRCMQDGS